MKKSNTSVVVTSIFHPTKALQEIAKGVRQNNWNFIIVGDASSPKDFYLEGADFYNLEEQKSLELKLALLCPERHYTRKNLGYLIAIGSGSEIIIETDDDNIPVADFWLSREKTLEVDDVKGVGWANIYNLFTDIKVWPRGLPLENVFSKKDLFVEKNSQKTICPIQQGLADENPDVDAIFRMTQELPIDFDKKERPFRLGVGLWCPFNSQNTTWFEEAFPLLYLPSFCTFRMTDIWRSFVAQRVSWECGWEIVFHNATVYQERNEHNLLKDFELEVPGYLLNNKIKESLEDLSLKSGTENIANNLLVCYEELIKNGIITDSKELILLTAWLEDVQKLMNYNNGGKSSKRLAISR